MGCMLPSKFPGASEPDIDHPTNGKRMVESLKGRAGTVGLPGTSIHILGEPTFLQGWGDTSKPIHYFLNYLWWATGGGGEPGSLLVLWPWLCSLVRNLQMIWQYEQLPVCRGAAVKSSSTVKDFFFRIVASLMKMMCLVQVPVVIVYGHFSFFANDRDLDESISAI